MQVCLSLLYIPGVLQLIQLNHWPVQNTLRRLLCFRIHAITVYVVYPAQGVSLRLHLWLRLIAHIHRSPKESHGICGLAFGVLKSWIQCIMKRAGSFWQPPPPAWGCVSLSLWMSGPSMNYEPWSPPAPLWPQMDLGQRCPSEERCRRASVLYEGLQLFVQSALCVLLPSVHLCWCSVKTKAKCTGNSCMWTGLTVASNSKNIRGFLELFLGLLWFSDQGWKWRLVI